jgi:hypothetical protein
VEGETGPCEDQDDEKYKEQNHAHVVPTVTGVKQLRCANVRVSPVATSPKGR